MTYQEIKNNQAINTYIQQADASLAALGYTEHSFAHVGLVAEKAGYILETLGYPARTVELCKIAGYMHDIGNLVNRVDHSQSGAVMAFRLLDNMGFAPEEIGAALSAAAAFPALRVRGLMAVPPICRFPDENLPYFNLMHQLFIDNGAKKYDNVAMDFMSMGMSGDYQAAISCGANMIRLGTAIFGKRLYPEKKV